MSANRDRSKPAFGRRGKGRGERGKGKGKASLCRFQRIVSLWAHGVYAESVAPGMDRKANEPPTQAPRQREETFPTVSSYLEGLPHGWASFPRCVARASLLGVLRERGALDVLEGLPERLDGRTLLSYFTTDAEWLPEVVHVATLLAVRDGTFAGYPRADEDFHRWVSQLNRDLLGGAGYFPSLAVSRPQELLRGLPALWETAHIGTPMTVRVDSATSASITIAHPAPLLHPLALESRRRTLALVLAKVGMVQPVVQMRTIVSGVDAETIFDATWS